MELEIAFESPVHSAADESGCLPLRLTLERIQRPTQWPRSATPAPVVRQADDGRGRFQTVAQAA